MADEPQETEEHKANAASEERETPDDIGAIIGPPTATPPQEPPAAHESQEPHHRRKKWLHDPPMFWVTLAGVVAVVAYTSVAAWQANLTQRQVTDAESAAAVAHSDEMAAISAANAVASSALSGAHEDSQEALSGASVVAANALSENRAEAMADRRPWVGVIRGHANTLDRPADEGGGPDIEVDYSNFGREPATKLSARSAAAEIPKRAFVSEAGNREILASIDKACVLAVKSKVNNIAYPTGEVTSYALWPSVLYSGNTDAIKAGTNVIVTYGCISYEYNGTPHQSGFCMFYDAKTTSVPNLLFCPVGNFTR